MNIVVVASYYENEFGYAHTNKQQEKNFNVFFYISKKSNKKHFKVQYRLNPLVCILCICTFQHAHWTKNEQTKFLVRRTIKPSEIQWNNMPTKAVQLYSFQEASNVLQDRKENNVDFNLILLKHTIQMLSLRNKLEVDALQKII